MSIPSTGLSRDERSGGGGVDYVRTLAETAKILGVSVPLLERLIRAGQGPAVIQLSPRRIGIRDSARNAWLDSQQRVAQPA